MKINLHNTDIDELVAPRGGHIGLLESRKALKSLYNSPKWDGGFRSTKVGRTKRKNIKRDIATRDLATIAFNARMESMPEEVVEAYDLRQKDLDEMEVSRMYSESAWGELL